MIRRIVDLPQPDGPTSTMNSPSPISRETSFTATTSVPEHLGHAVEDDLGHRFAPSGFGSESRSRPSVRGSRLRGCGPRRPARRRGGRGRARPPRPRAERSGRYAHACGATVSEALPRSARRRAGRRSGRSRRRAPRRRRGAHPQPPDRRAGHRDDLVGLPVHDVARDRVALGGRSEQRAARAPRAAARRAGRSRWPPSLVEAASGRSARARSARGCVFGPRPSSVADRVPSASPPSSPARPSRRRSVRSRGSGRCVRSGATAEQFDAVAAHDAHAPRAFGAGAEHGERVVAEQVRLGPASSGRVQRNYPSVVGGQVGAGQAVDAEFGDRQAMGIHPGLCDASSAPTAACDVSSRYCVVNHCRPSARRRGRAPPRGGCRPGGGERRRPSSPRRRPARAADRFTGAASSSSTADEARACRRRRRSTIARHGLAGAARASCGAARRPRRRVRARPPTASSTICVRRAPRLPVLELDVPADVAVPELCEHPEHPRVVGAVAERAAEPGAGVDARDLPDCLLRPPCTSCAQPLVGERVIRAW